MTESYDLIVIGSGPGGYRAAEQASLTGLSVLLVEREGLGGVCLNRGCIPTKCLLNASKHFSHGKKAGAFGVHFDNPRFVLSEAMAWKDRTVKTLSRGVESIMKRTGVTVLKGEAVVPERGFVVVEGREYRANTIILAGGSAPWIPPIPGAEAPMVKTSREILSLRSLPEEMVIIGGGVIGIEFASFFSAVGTRVHVVEMADEICPMMDREIARTLRSSMEEVTFHLSSKVTNIEKGRVVYVSDGKESAVSADLVLMSVGRKPNIAGIDIPGLDIGSEGIRVNNRMATNLPGVYAIGDITGRSLLAHSAYRMAEVAVSSITGGKSIMRYGAVPWAVYTDPEAAGCGMTVEEALRQGRKARTAKVRMAVNGRFLAENTPESPGVCIIVSDEATGVLLGVHMLGPYSSEIIHSASVMIEAELTLKEIGEIIFPHPTVSEVLRDAVLEATHSYKE
ncbi:MAG: dihydrolipoyl dehydrogenase [Spirochaetales bacterium]|nr:dihydrolipoyl dehydrogenase [Spirochaetales bacterium]